MNNDVDDLMHLHMKRSLERAMEHLEAFADIEYLGR